MTIIEKGLNSIGDFAQKAEGSTLKFLSNDEFYGEWTFSEKDYVAYRENILEPENKKTCRSAKVKVERLNLKAITHIEVLTEEKAGSIKGITKGAIAGAGAGLLTVGAGIGALAGAALKATDKVFLVEVTFSGKKKSCAYMSRMVYEKTLVNIRSEEQLNVSGNIIDVFNRGGEINEELLQQKKRANFLFWLIILAPIGLYVTSKILC